MFERRCWARQPPLDVPDTEPRYHGSLVSTRKVWTWPIPYRTSRTCLYGRRDFTHLGYAAKAVRQFLAVRLPVVCCCVPVCVSCGRTEGGQVSGHM